MRSEPLRLRPRQRHPGRARAPRRERFLDGSVGAGRDTDIDYFSRGATIRARCGRSKSPLEAARLRSDEPMSPTSIARLPRRSIDETLRVSPTTIDEVEIVSWRRASARSRDRGLAGRPAARHGAVRNGRAMRSQGCFATPGGVDTPVYRSRCAAAGPSGRRPGDHRIAASPRSSSTRAAAPCAGRPSWSSIRSIERHAWTGRPTDMDVQPLKIDGVKLAILQQALRGRRPQDGEHAAAHRRARACSTSARDFSCVRRHRRLRAAGRRREPTRSTCCAAPT